MSLQENRKAAFVGGLSSSRISISAESVLQVLLTMRTHQTQPKCRMLKMASQQGRRESGD